MTGVDLSETHFAFVERNREIFTSILSVAVTEPKAASGGRGRDTHYRQLFRREFADLADEEAEEWFAILRRLISAFSHLIYRTRLGFDPPRRGRPSNLPQRRWWRRSPTPMPGPE